MDYGNYTYNNIKNAIFEFSKKSKSSNVFWHCWCSWYDKSLFWISYSDSVYLTIYIYIYLYLHLYIHYLFIYKYIYNLYWFIDSLIYWCIAFMYIHIQLTRIQAPDSRSELQLLETTFWSTEAKRLRTAPALVTRFVTGASRLSVLSKRVVNPCRMPWFSGRDLHV